MATDVREQRPDRKDYFREYYRKNKAKILSVNESWWKSHPEKLREKWRRAHAVDNLCVSCATCNLTKHNQSVRTWVRVGQQFLEL